MSTDRIEKEVVLKAPQSRVWQALTDSEQFGSWFGVKLDGPFVAGQAISGRMSGTTVDPEIAAMQREYAHIPFDLVIDRIEPEHLFSFRWHPGADNKAAGAGDPMTLVTFELEPTAEGVWLRVTESGFDRIPIERRAQAFSGNSEGWSIQMRLIEAYLEQSG